MTREDHDIQPEDTMPPGGPNDAASEIPTGLVLHSGQQLPDTPNLLRQLRLGLDEVMAARAKVTCPEDSYAIQRQLARIGAESKSYANAFATFEKSHVRPAVAEVLADVVGEQDGVPNQGMVVPDTDGTNIKIGLDQVNEYEIDAETVFQAVALAVMEESRDFIRRMFQAEYAGDGTTSQMILTGLFAEVCKQAVAVGKFDPQVSKVRAFATEVARREGGELTSAVLMSSIKKTVKFKGVKVDRVTPKAAK